ncbi:MAG: hypothetical protein LQ352_003875 [Teloschistes flavicans]|nr:MAG: hypothetical protein LQ352_003875 [Teloschistes flavicans]
MCVIERFNRIFPNGYRVPAERVRHCQFGTPDTPCNAARVVMVMDEMVGPQPDFRPSPQHHTIEPRPANRKNKSRKVYDGLKLVFDFPIPFTTYKRKETKKPKKNHDHGGRMEGPNNPPYPTVPPSGYVPMMPPVPGPHPPPPPPGPPGVRPGGPLTPPISVHPPSSTNSSPSPTFPFREHQRPRTRSLSQSRQYEERKRAIREREGREHAERVLIVERERRIQAQRLAERIRIERDLERRRNEELRSRKQRCLTHERRHRIEDADRERRRRSREERDIARWAEQRAADERVERQLREEANLRRAERQRLDRIREDRERLERQRDAGICRRPRHAATIHHPGRVSFEQQAREDYEREGQRAINGAIRQAQWAQLDDARPRWIAENRPQRRGTFGGGRRVIDDNRRWPWRW